MKAEYYNEDMFVNPGTLQRYRCTRCKKVPKQFYRCQCRKADNGPPKNSYSGLSCSKCKHKVCSACKQKDQCERYKTTDNKVKGLTVFCERKCGAKPLLRALDQHLSQECPNRRRPCKYSWLGCTVVGDGGSEEMRQHEEDINLHFALVDELRQRIDAFETLYKTAQGKPVTDTSS